MIMNLYRNIDRSKIQFDFVIDRADELFFADEIRNLGGKIYILPKFNFRNSFIFNNAWKNFFEKHPEYKIIHGHVRSTASIYLKTAKKYGLVTIAHSHSTSSGMGFSAIVKNMLQYRIRYIADYFLACSEEAGVWLFGKKTCKKKNFYIFNNAIDMKKYIYNKEIRTMKRKELNLEDKFVIGHVGRFVKPKNHKFLIDVFKKVHDKEPSAVLLLIGEGELKPQIEKKVINLGLHDSVLFTGVRSDIPELLQAMDIFVFPSLYEGLGIVTIEAQTSGLPCIVADTIPKEAFITELIQKIPLKEDKKLWVEEILKFKDANNRETPKEIMVSGFDIEEKAHEIESLYNEIVQTHQNGEKLIQ
ncbi:glycosyltransferase EpsF2 [Acetobacterium woodii DSM 1030]|uniref:Glycosyltransferase EpsF2 n=2 Tax=Acetobacterium woodii TaxID=33952 RepID=H6LBC4_ACEWD|nr:glycosyltransferase EpsF2 [Acetobacterium woodii DSM 1030]